MAQSRAAQGKRYKKSKKKSKKGFIVFIIISLVLTICVVGVVIAFNSGMFKTKQYPQKYGEYVEKASNEYNLSTSFIYAVIRTESKFNSDAQSGVGACGLMQITPDTFETYMNIRGESGKYTTNDLFDPASNIDYGCYILRDHLDTFENEECALAAYNAGPGNVTAWLEDPNISPDGKTLIVDNIPQSFAETRNYIIKVEEAEDIYKDLYEDK